MYKYVIAFALILTGCSAKGHFKINTPDVKSHNNSHATQSHEKPGIGYTNSTQACYLARDLTDEEIDNADNGTGSGYHDGKRSAEEADKIETVDESVAFYYQDDDGNIIIFDDGDEITVIDVITRK